MHGRSKAREGRGKGSARPSLDNLCIRCIRPVTIINYRRSSASPPVHVPLPFATAYIVRLLNGRSSMAHLGRTITPHPSTFSLANVPLSAHVRSQVRQAPPFSLPLLSQPVSPATLDPHVRYSLVPNASCRPSFQCAPRRPSIGLDGQGRTPLR